MRPASYREAQGLTVRDVNAAIQRAFADEFFDRFVQGREVVDYAPLLARAGLILRKRSPGRPWIGEPSLDFTNGTPRIAMPTVEDTPLYIAGLDRNDELLSFDGVAVTGQSRLEEAVQRRRPGDRVRVAIRRRGVAEELMLTVGEDPRLQVVPVERTGRQLSPAEREFRQRWLGSKQ